MDTLHDFPIKFWTARKTWSIHLHKFFDIYQKGVKIYTITLEAILNENDLLKTSHYM